MKITSIEEIDREPVWDISVKEHPEFILDNGIIAHNSLYPKDIMSGGCFEEGTLIKMADGSNKAINEIKVGELVITRDGPRAVSYTWNPDTLVEGNPECYEIEFEDGTIVNCSDTHPFSINGSWVQAQDLVAGIECDTVDNSEIYISKITKVDKKKVYDLTVEGNHEYTLSNGVVVSNTGNYYGANSIFFIGRQQIKDGTEVSGYNFVINVEKSRFVKEKSKIPISISWENGIEKWSGLLDVAKELGYVICPKSGWYQAFDPATQTALTGNLRASATMNKEFWEDIIFSRTGFKNAVRNHYTISLKEMLSSDKVSAVEPDEDNAE